MHCSIKYRVKNRDNTFRKGVRKSFINKYYQFIFENIATFLLLGEIFYSFDRRKYPDYLVHMRCETRKWMRKY